MVGIDDTFISEESNPRRRNLSGRQRRVLILKQMLGQKVKVNDHDNYVVEGELREIRDASQPGFYVGNRFVSVASIQRIYAENREIVLYGARQ